VPKKAAPKKTSKETATKQSVVSKAGVSGSARTTKQQVADVVAWLERTGTKSHRDGMSRYAIPNDKAFGIPVGTLRQYAKRLGRNHELAAALWDAEWYEARMLATFVEVPDEITPAQMDRWCRDFDSWAICDTACFGLFDRTPHAWKKVDQWAGRKNEFEKRAGFALLACLALHDQESGDREFLRYLPLIERGAEDDRNFVKKAVNWALRGIGGRSPALHAASVKLARKLGESRASAPRWVGKDALRGLMSPAMTRRVARRAEKAKS
jgi:3-methyladenine DNA glycosylase AlkD